MAAKKGRMPGLGDFMKPDKAMKPKGYSPNPYSFGGSSNKGRPAKVAAKDGDKGGTVNAEVKQG